MVFLFLPSQGNTIEMSQMTIMVDWIEFELFKAPLVWHKINQVSNGSMFFFKQEAHNAHALTIYEAYHPN